MEANEGLKTSKRKSSSGPPQAWIRSIPAEKEVFGFAAGFEFDRQENLTDFAKRLPEGTVVCDSRLIAGVDHLESILLQASEYWKRGEFLARNRSIDLLMRISCRGQISEAVRLADNENRNSVVLWGLAKSRGEIEKAVELLTGSFRGARRNDRLIDLTKEKESYLKQIHSLPKSIIKAQLLVTLKERSLLLIFSR